MSMSKETELRTLSRLVARGQLAWSSLPKSVEKSPILKELIATQILSKEGRGAGSVVKIVDAEALQAFLDQRFPGRDTTLGGDAFSNQHRYRDSKGAAKKSIGVILLRGWTTVSINNQQVDLTHATHAYGCFAAVKPQLNIPRLCLVENLDSFMEAEKILGTDWVYAHTYGRLGRDTLQGLDHSNILHFGDWDYTGLDEYLRLKKQFPQTKLFLPEHLEDLWRSQSKPLKKGAVITKRLSKSDDPDVQRVLTLLGQTNQFLEQQAPFLQQNTKL